MLLGHLVGSMPIGQYSLPFLRYALVRKNSGQVDITFRYIYVSLKSVELSCIESRCRITPLSNIRIEAPLISGKNFYGLTSKRWLPYKDGPYRSLCFLAMIKMSKFSVKYTYLEWLSQLIDSHRIRWWTTTSIQLRSPVTANWNSMEQNIRLSL